MTEPTVESMCEEQMVIMNNAFGAAGWSEMATTDDNSVTFNEVAASNAAS